MRQDNIAVFQDTMKILKQGYYKIGDESRKLKLTREQMEAARVFLPEACLRVGKMRIRLCECGFLQSCQKAP